MTINAEEMIQRLRDAVKLRGPDFNYQKYFNPESEFGNCVYSVNNEPACIIGFALWDLLPPDMETIKNDLNFGLNSVDVYDLDREYKLLDDDAITIAQYAQVTQDSGRTWGEALEVAEFEFDRICNGR